MRHFADVPSNNLPGDDFSTIKTENDKPFKEEFYENVIFIKPVRKACNMEFRWCMPSLLNVSISVGSIISHFIKFI